MCLDEIPSQDLPTESSDTAKKSNTTFEILETCCNLMQGLQNLSCERLYGSAVIFTDFLREIIEI